jgi:hypothetical protein
MSKIIVPRTIHVFVSLVLCTVSIVSLANTDSTMAMLEALQSEWNQAHMKGDAATLEALWSDDLVVAVPVEFGLSFGLQMLPSFLTLPG